MRRKLSPWCKSVKHAMIDKDLTTVELAGNLGMAREYTSAVITGRVISWQARRKISDYLGIAFDDGTEESGATVIDS